MKVCKGEKGCAAVGGTEQWKNDKYCDDVNNNEACGWDGGDCCNNSNANWSRWCYVSLLIYNGDIVFSYAMSKKEWTVYSGANLSRSAYSPIIFGLFEQFVF